MFLLLLEFYPAIFFKFWNAVRHYKTTTAGLKSRAGVLIPTLML